MFWEEPRVPGLPGAEDVTDGSVDYYDTDWETVENGALEDINGRYRGQVSIATRSGGGLECSLRRGKDSHPGYAEACRFTTFRHVPPGACRCAR